MKKILYPLYIVLSIFIFAGCQKSGDSAGGASAILTSGKWQMLSDTSVMDIPGYGQVTQDLFDILDPCVTDNYAIFNTNGSCTTDEGATKCDPSSPQTVTEGTWKLLNNNTQLQVAAPNPLGAGTLTITADILQLDDSYMRFRYVTDAGGLHAVSTERLKHIK